MTLQHIQRCLHTDLDDILQHIQRCLHTYLDDILQHIHRHLHTDLDCTATYKETFAYWHIWYITAYRDTYIPSWNITTYTQAYWLRHLHADRYNISQHTERHTDLVEILQHIHSRYTGTCILILQHLLIHLHTNLHDILQLIQGHLHTILDVTLQHI